MTPELKSFITGMEKAGKLAAETLSHVAKYVKPSVSTNYLDQIVHDFTLSHGAKSAPLGYHGYPKACCTSVNEVICHGVPNDIILKEGDIINVDVTPVLNGYYGDTSATFFVGQVSDTAKKIVETARLARDAGIEAIRPNGKTGDIGFETYKVVTRAGFYVVREIGGHGIGTKFHTDPFVPAFGKKGKGEILKPWTCITVEPMINETSAELKEHDIANSNIKWYTTSDQTLSAQFEHTVLITDTGYQILTLS